MRTSVDRILATHAGRLERQDCHATLVVEQPELILRWLRDFPSVVGRDGEITPADGDLGDRVPPRTTWVKLRALVTGVGLTTRGVWRAGMAA
jgi:hypothetical protein